MAGTLNIYDHPLPYARAYAMAKYLLEHGYKTKPTAEESAELTSHNEAYMEVSDCEEVIRTFFRPPFEGEKGRALSAAEVMQMMRVRGFYGKGYSAADVGRSLRRRGYEPHVIKGVTKYLVVEKDTEALKTEGTSDALTILHNMQQSIPSMTVDCSDEEIEPF